MVFVPDKNEKKVEKKGIHKKALRFVYNDSSISSTLKEAITKDKPVTLHNSLC